MRDNNIISILDVLLTETMLVTKARYESGTATVLVPDSYESWTGRIRDHHSGGARCEAVSVMFASQGPLFAVQN